MTENKILKWALILSIIIIANLFFNYTLSLVFNSPEYSEFCSLEKTNQRIQNEQQCVNNNGTWTPYPEIINETGAKDGQCDLYTKCGEQYQEVNKVYEQKVFIALIAIGVLMLLASFFMKSNSVVAMSFALTAVLDFVIASTRYWSYSDELLKVGILFIALATLIYVAIKKFKDRN